MANRIVAHLCLAALSLAALVACGGSDDAPAAGGGTGGTTTTTPPPVVGITKIEIASTEPMWGGASFGTVGAYEKLTGKAYGRLDPKDPKNAGMVFIDKAPLDADGMVAYSTEFLLMRPVDASKGSGKLFYNVVNRGNDQSLMR